MKREIRESIPYEDFSRLYKVFEEPPYNEKWTNEEVKSEYNHLLEKGHVCGYYDNDYCIGVVTFRPHIPNEHPIHYEDHLKVVYVSDLIVLSTYRGRGIGSSLMRYALETSKHEGFDFAYMRTLEKGLSMSYGLAVRIGFVPLNGVFQNVSQERTTYERSKIDKRIFLEVNLHNWS